MPDPFTDDTIDLLKELQRIKGTNYTSDFELHQDISTTVKRLGDGHAGYLNYCYDSLYTTYLPFPLAVLARPDALDVQNIYIVPEASEIATTEFRGGAVKIWQSALGRNLSDFDGAQVVSINGQDPWTVVDAYTATSGDYQSKTTRENGFFSSYIMTDYRLGTFAQLPLPNRGENVTLTLIRNGTTAQETYNVPYLSRIGNSTIAFTNAKTLWANNCRATRSTNGGTLFDSSSRTQLKTVAGLESPGSEDPLAQPARFQRDPIVPQVVDGRRLATSSLVVDGPEFDIALPERLAPSSPVSSVGAMDWYVLDNGTTAVLQMSSFSGTFRNLQQGVLDGIRAVKAQGANKLLIDLTNNGGGIICLAAWLHRVLAGPQPGLDVQPGLNGSVRAKDLPQKLVANIIANTTGVDATDSYYNPSNWRDVNGQKFPANFNWLNPPVDMLVNGVLDKFSQRVGDTCLPFSMTPPATQPFEFDNIAIMTNGRCASSCSLFSILMRTKYNVKTVVVGGRPGTTQQYCGVVGGMSLNFVPMNLELKSFGLKNDSLSPPDFLTNSYQGITWRLAWSPSDPNSFEEFRSHPAQFTFPLLPSTVNNPMALWRDVSKRLWPN